MKRWNYWIAAALCLLLIGGCAEKPVQHTEPETDKIQIIGQLDDATDNGAKAALVTSEPDGPSEESSAAQAVPSEEPTSEPTATPVPTEAPTEEPTEEPTATPVPTPTPAPNRTKAEKLCDAALALIDEPYARGGTSTETGFDPGGFVYYCLNEVGVKVRHKTSKGYSENEDWLRVDSIDDLEKGDLCFFMTGSNESVNCVCIYLGDGEMIYPSSSKGLVITTKITSDYWRDAFVYARRVF